MIIKYVTENRIISCICKRDKSIGKAEQNVSIIRKTMGLVRFCMQMDSEGGGPCPRQQAVCD